MDKFDCGSLNLENIKPKSIALPIADDIEKSRRVLEDLSKAQAERTAAIVAGAQANIEQKELLEDQLEQLKTQNKLLEDNYRKLEEMYNDQKESYNSAREDLKRSHRFNAWMMVIAIIAMLAAVAGPIVTFLVSR